MPRAEAHAVAVARSQQGHDAVVADAVAHAFADQPLGAGLQAALPLIRERERRQILDVHRTARILLQAAGIDEQRRERRFTPQEFAAGWHYPGEFIEAE